MDFLLSGYRDGLHSDLYFRTFYQLAILYENKPVKEHNQFVWFKKWVMEERQVYKYLVRDSGMSRSALQRLFSIYLKKATIVAIRSKTNVHLLIDGTYFSNELCLILYYDHDIGYVQLYRETDQEKYKEIKEDLENLLKLDENVYSVVHTDS